MRRVQGHLRRDGEVVLRLERAAVEPDLEAEIDELAHLRLVAVEGVHHAAAWGEGEGEGEGEGSGWG